MSDAKVHFRSEPFKMFVAGKGLNPIECTALVYDDPSNCGLGMQYEDGTAEVWGLMTPRNLIAAWRGTQILPLLEIVASGTLCRAYYAGLRNPHNSDMERQVQPVIAEIGLQAYSRIMALPIPESIVRAILDNQGTNFPPNTWPIIEEVRAGTLEWRQEFADAGIEHPDLIDAKERREKIVFARYQQLLTAYAKMRKWSTDCFGMGHVEAALLTLVEKGADHDLTRIQLVALAGVVGELSSTEFAMNFMSFGPRSTSEYRGQMEMTKGEALWRDAEWLYANSGTWFTRLFVNKFEGSSANRNLLESKLSEYFPAEGQTK